MDIFVAFEIDNSGTEKVARAMVEKGYSRSWKVKEQSYKLPSNCVWKVDGTLAGCKEEFLNVISNLGINTDDVKSCIVLNATPWTGIASK